MNDPVSTILGLLGDVVLIPNRALTKKPSDSCWQKTTRDCMSNPDYRRKFVGKNIGVLLGEPSGGLCTIDLDNDNDVEAFLTCNPRLRETTRTKRVRGCNFWIYIEGRFPRSATFVAMENGASRPFGEWRADGNQTIIYGRVIDERKGETEPTNYKFLNEVPPIHIAFDEILLPENVSFKGGKETQHTPPICLNAASYVSTSLHDCIPASLHNSAETILANIRAKADAQKALEGRYPQLARIYSAIVEPRFQAQVGARNAFIVESVPFLFRVVATRFVGELIGHFYDCNRALFNDPREQHMNESKAMLQTVINTYVEALNTGERKIYEALSEPEQSAFRICRDLAFLPEPAREPLTFFLSFNHLADRLGIHPPQAQRIMRGFANCGLIILREKGTRRAVGVPGIAGSYEWMLK